ncbi:MAG: hypothetical protein ACRDPG_09115 [Nocardioidaceae bacterium]
MTTAVLHHPAPVARVSEVWHRAQREPAYGAFWLLRIGFVVLPLWMGADKFANTLTYWPHYLAPWIVSVLPFSAQTAMYVVGVIEVIAAIAVAVKPRYASYIVAAWLGGIVINLLSYSGFYDVALRDFALLLAALTLARLSSIYDKAWFDHRHADTA